MEFDNAFKVQWEMFLRHVAEDAPFPHTFVDGARGVQLAELGMQSWASAAGWTCRRSTASWTGSGTECGDGGDSAALV